jgi:putative Mg2+ transporter-C (MgtC) family protein
VLAGALIGLDRMEHAHPAGLRTNVLVCVAGALAMLLANLLFSGTPDTRISIVRLDFMRLPLGILTGIGFIGAGAILRQGELVRGVTTAATLWLVTVIGICFGAGFLGLGCVATGIGLGTLFLLKYVERWIKIGRRGVIVISSDAGGPDEAALLDLLQVRGFVIRARQFVRDPESGHSLECSGRYRGDYPDWSRALVHDLLEQPGVRRVEWRDVD